MSEIAALRDRGYANAGTAGVTYANPGDEDAINWNPDTGCPSARTWEAINTRRVGDWERAKGPAVDAEGRCCYRMEPDCPGGRPFIVQGEARLPTLMGGSASTCDTLEAALAASYEQDALIEYASVAAFARLTLGLMAFGAPAELIRSAQLASLDELRHADFCFQQAARHGGGLSSAGPLSMTNALADLSLEGLIESNLIEGCIGETLAASHVTEQARYAETADLRARLLAIAEDETRHAELAWEILRWAFDSSPELTRSVVMRVLGTWELPEPMDQVFSADPRWNAEGRLSARQSHDNAMMTFDEVVKPLLVELHSVRQLNVLGNEQTV